MFQQLIIGRDMPNPMGELGISLLCFLVVVGH